MRRLASWFLIVFTWLNLSAANASAQTDSGVLLPRIEQARLRVNSERVNVIYGVVGTRRVRVGRRSFKEVPITGIVGREMAVALLGPDDHIRIVRAIKRDSGIEVLTPGMVLSLRRDNGINSDIACIQPAGSRVLAVKYPVLNERNRFGPGPDIIEAVYTPYSAEIKIAEVTGRGVEVQYELISKAYRRLKELNVYSRAFEDRKVVDVIPPNVMNVLLLNEHIDPSEFSGAELTKLLVERVLTVIATNRERAFAYSISPAGARGLVQMIPSTYSRIATLYPAAGLLSNFALGMADPVNAIMAQVLLCDSDWSAIRKTSEVPPERIGPYLAAAYNGGVGRVLSVLSSDETDWMDNPEANRQPRVTVSRRVPLRVRTGRGRMRTKYVVRRYTADIFRSETNKYVRQYHWINAFLVANKLDGPKPDVNGVR